MIGEAKFSRPYRNRVQSTGDILADPAKGLFLGNRGRIHNDDKTLGPVRWRNRSWITCVPTSPTPCRVVMGERGYTHLFFLDEAVAFAAGHRPCAQCRRDAYDRFRAAWGIAFGKTPLAPQIDRRMHADRIDPATDGQRRHACDLFVLPDGSIIFMPGTDQPALVLGTRLHPCRPEGYGEAQKRPAFGTVTVLTPKCSIAILAAGYRPKLHHSVEADSRQ